MSIPLPALNDTFTGTSAGQSIATHVADSGQTWSVVQGSIVFTTDGCIRSNASGTSIAVLSSGSGSTNLVVQDQTFEAILPLKTCGAAGDYIAIGSGYGTGSNGGEIRIDPYDNYVYFFLGGSQQIANTSNISSGGSPLQQYVCIRVIANATGGIALYINGVEQSFFNFLNSGLIYIKFVTAAAQTDTTGIQLNQLRWYTSNLGTSTYLYPNDRGIDHSPGNWDTSQTQDLTVNIGAWQRIYVNTYDQAAGIVVLNFNTSANTVGNSWGVTTRIGGQENWTNYSQGSTISLNTSGYQLASPLLVEFRVSAIDRSVNNWLLGQAHSCPVFTGYTLPVTSYSITPPKFKKTILIFGDSTFDGGDGIGYSNLNFRERIGCNEGNVSFSGNGYVNNTYAGQGIGTNYVPYLGVITGGVSRGGSQYLYLHDTVPRSFAGVDLIILADGQNDQGQSGQVQGAVYSMIVDIITNRTATAKVMVLGQFTGNLSGNATLVEQALIAAVTQVNSARVLYKAKTDYMIDMALTSGNVGYYGESPEGIHPTDSAYEAKFLGPFSDDLRSLLWGAVTSLNYGSTAAQYQSSGGVVTPPTNSTPNYGPVPGGGAS